MSCSGCNSRIAAGSALLKCYSCKSKYHCECLNISPNQYSALTKELKASWKCPSCNNVTHRSRSNQNTPVRSSLMLGVENANNQHSDPPTKVSQDCCNKEMIPSAHVSTTLEQYTEIDKFAKDIQATLHAWKSDMELQILKMGDLITTTLSDIKGEIQAMRSENSSLKSQLGELTKVVAELQTTVDYQESNHLDLKRCVDKLSSKDSMVECLETKIDNLEQQSRQCNLEICNLPEKRGENLITIMDSIGAAIGCGISNQDIISIHRVPHAHQQNKKPKNVIVKLRTRTLRDNILSAVRLAKGLTTDRLGIAGSPTPIYLNEHITLKRKTLFRECRDAAKRCGFKYIWIKHATILARESDTSPIFSIRSQADIKKIKRTAHKNQNVNIINE